MERNETRPCACASLYKQYSGKRINAPRAWWRWRRALPPPGRSRASAPAARHTRGVRLRLTTSPSPLQLYCIPPPPSWISRAPTPRQQQRPFRIFVKGSTRPSGISNPPRGSYGRRPRPIYVSPPPRGPAMVRGRHVPRRVRRGVCC